MRSSHFYLQSAWSGLCTTSPTTQGLAKTLDDSNKEGGDPPDAASRPTLGTGCSALQTSLVHKIGSNPPLRIQTDDCKQVMAEVLALGVRS